MTDENLLPSQCKSGKCENGVCTENVCTGSVCQNFSACGPGGSCICASTTDGTGFCVDSETPCSGLADCTISEDCGTGMVCVVSSCCRRNVCASGGTCGGGGGGASQSGLLKGRFIEGLEGLEKRGWINSTIASEGVWVP